MTGTSLRNPIAVLMACIALIVFSAVVTPRLSVDTFPELTPPVLVVGTQVPGMGPKDVEKTITWRLEKFVSATPGVDHVQSVSRAGLSIIYVWLKWGTELNSAQTLVQQQVAFAMSSVPKSLGVVPSFVLQYDPTNAPVVQIAVYGGGLSGPRIYDYAANVIEPVLEGIPGVASAAPDGGRERQINVVVDPVRASARGITGAEVSAAVARANALLPSGRFIAKGFDANVYTNAVPKKVAEIGEAVVKVVDGRPVLIQDVARVEDGGSPSTQGVAIDGEESVYLNVLRVPGGNVLAIVDAVGAALGEMKDLPPGMKIVPVFDQSTFVRSTFHGLKAEIVQAFCLVALVILLFLQSPRSVAIAAVAVPISFAIILIVLYVSGQTLNAFTLGGLTLSMGPLVDISVVVLESVHRQRLAGKSAFQAALDGTNAVAIPALAATLSTIAVLLPVVLLAGLAKKLFAPLALTVATGMVAGYVVSMTVTPVACRYFLGHAHTEPGPLAKRVEVLLGKVTSAYVSALAAVLPYRGYVAVAATILVVASAWAASRLPTTFFPEVDEGMECTYVRFAPGTSLEDANRKMGEMGKLLRQELPPGSVELVLTNVGTPGKARSAMNSPNAGPHMGFIRLALSNPAHRALSQRDIADRMRGILVHAYPGVDFLQAPGGLVASVFANGYLAPIVVELRGENLDELMARSRAVAEVARQVPGIRDIYTNLQTDYPEIRVDGNRQEAGLVGVSLRDVAQTTLEGTLGNINTPGVWVDGSNGQSYYVVTSYDPEAVRDANALAALPVRATVGSGAVALGTYGHIERGAGPIAIERDQLTRAATIYLQTEGRDIGSAARELEEKLAKDPRTKDVPFSFVGQIDLMRTTFSGLGVAVGLAIMVVFMIMATQFQSLRLPFVMLFAVPVALVGIVFALLAAGQGFSITALMGVLMVIGIAVSNGILLVDHANRVLQRCGDAREAILEAARVRFVPIAMTSLATIIGLLPTALGLEKAAAANQPLALAVVGGLSSSTLLSLFLVPAMFTAIAKRNDETSGLEVTSKGMLAS
ncbi:efflux RND transporter permease subunit [Pendulispora albinea]|uniref:Efflux RND transporter permease subunit n=1 Tax=Pendulispora albinea TaxID=2741071 RepID=A0ABZ2LT61_9BACT